MFTRFPWRLRFENLHSYNPICNVLQSHLQLSGLEAAQPPLGPIRLHCLDSVDSAAIQSIIGMHRVTIISTNCCRTIMIIILSQRQTIDNPIDWSFWVPKTYKC